MQETNLIIYKSENKNISVQVQYEDGTFWLTQKRMAELYDVESNTITYHLQEIYKSGELQHEATTQKIRVVQREGSRDVSRNLDFYNLDAIIAVGYRVNSFQATKFRIWATQTQVA
ncbi:MAG: virulence RhuM family protein [Bacteroidales bacterium]|nr:virulence RhuM family protein [Bacteroidales bacterium]